ncbi:hypothetical protein PGT21_019332 [Puccinia graminis f. sp. tritici]|uniref:Uncharacterized protein n=1 Tax=Puccinia graminis f. sp. tritici TaxID=56615 RepID=A0A5B0PXY2_PUCGR|nr:hypothetical protein PGT21_019332 [Puccinia graminis f. sp. tritici]KAA1135131.1 hypothetical protein PGTUg99_018107 [Puccinia graminis f. sp. tritici]
MPDTVSYRLCGTVAAKDPEFKHDATKDSETPPHQDKDLKSISKGVFSNIIPKFSKDETDDVRSTPINPPPVPNQRSCSYMQSRLDELDAETKKEIW